MAARAAGDSSATLTDEGAGRFAFRGALSFDSAPALWRRTDELLGGGGAGERSVDLSAAAPVDSAGLALLVAWQARATAAGVTLRYLSAPTRLVALARISEVEPLLGL